MDEIEPEELTAAQVYRPQDIVWVKISGMWWVAEVQDQATLDPEVTEGLKKQPLVVVKFLNEDTYEHVRSWDNIYHYNNHKKKEEFLKLGFKKYYKLKNEKNVAKFPDDIKEAERRTGGNPDIVNDPKYLPHEALENKLENGERSSLPADFSRKKTKSLRLSAPAPSADDSSEHSDGDVSTYDKPLITKKGPTWLAYPKFINMVFGTRRPPPDEPSVDRLEQVDVKRCCFCIFETTDSGLFWEHQKYKQHNTSMTNPRLYRWRNKTELDKKKTGVKKTIVRRKKVTDPKSAEKKAVKRSKKSLPPVPAGDFTPPKKSRLSEPNTPSAHEVSQECAKIIEEWTDDEEEDKPLDDALSADVDRSASVMETELTPGIGLLDSTPKTNKPVVPTKPSSSCFDFDEEEPAKPDLQSLGKFGQTRLPRVITPEKSKPPDPLDDVDDIDTLLNEVSVPQIPALPPSKQDSLFSRGDRTYGSSPRKSSVTSPVKNDTPNDVNADIGKNKIEEKHFLAKGPLQSKKRKSSGLTEGAEDGSALNKKSKMGSSPEKPSKEKITPEKTKESSGSPAGSCNKKMGSSPEKPSKEKTTPEEMKESSCVAAGSRNSEGKDSLTPSLTFSSSSDRVTCEPDATANGQCPPDKAKEESGVVPTHDGIELNQKQLEPLIQPTEDTSKEDDSFLSPSRRRSSRRSAPQVASQLLDTEVEQVESKIKPSSRRSRRGNSVFPPDDVIDSDETLKGTADALVSEDHKADDGSEQTAESTEPNSEDISQIQSPKPKRHRTRKSKSNSKAVQRGDDITEDDHHQNEPAEQTVAVEKDEQARSHGTEPSVDTSPPKSKDFGSLIANSDILGTVDQMKSTDVNQAEEGLSSREEVELKVVDGSDQSEIQDSVALKDPITDPKLQTTDNIVNTDDGSEALGKPSTTRQEITLGKEEPDTLLSNDYPKKDAVDDEANQGKSETDGKSKWAPVPEPEEKRTPISRRSRRLNSIGEEPEPAGDNTKVDSISGNIPLDIDNSKSSTEESSHKNVPVRSGRRSQRNMSQEVPVSIPLPEGLPYPPDRASQGKGAMSPSPQGAKQQRRSTRMNSREGIPKGGLVNKKSSDLPDTPKPSIADLHTDEAMESHQTGSKSEGNPKPPLVAGDSSAEVAVSDVSALPEMNSAPNVLEVDVQNLEKPLIENAVLPSIESCSKPLSDLQIVQTSAMKLEDTSTATPSDRNASRDTLNDAQTKSERKSGDFCDKRSELTPQKDSPKKFLTQPPLVPQPKEIIPDGSPSATSLDESPTRQSYTRTSRSSSKRDGNKSKMTTPEQTSIESKRAKKEEKSKSSSRKNSRALNADEGDSKVVSTRDTPRSSRGDLPKEKSHDTPRSSRNVARGSELKTISRSERKPRNSSNSESNELADVVGKSPSDAKHEKYESRLCETIHLSSKSASKEDKSSPESPLKERKVVEGVKVESKMSSKELGEVQPADTTKSKRVSSSREVDVKHKIRGEIGSPTKDVGKSKEETSRKTVFEADSSDVVKENVCLEHLTPAGNKEMDVSSTEPSAVPDSVMETITTPCFVSSPMEGAESKPSPELPHSIEPIQKEPDMLSSNNHNPISPIKISTSVIGCDLVSPNKNNIDGKQQADSFNTLPVKKKSKWDVEPSKIDEPVANMAKVGDATFDSEVVEETKDAPPSVVEPLKICVSDSKIAANTRKGMVHSPSKTFHQEEAASLLEELLGSSPSSSPTPLPTKTATPDKRKSPGQTKIQTVDSKFCSSPTKVLDFDSPSKNNNLLAPPAENAVHPISPSSKVGKTNAPTTPTRTSRWDSPFPMKSSMSSLATSPSSSPGRRLKVEIKSGLGRGCLKSSPPEGLEPPKLPPHLEPDTSNNQSDDELSALQAEILSYSEMDKAKSATPIKKDVAEIAKELEDDGNSIQPATPAVITSKGLCDPDKGVDTKTSPAKLKNIPMPPEPSPIKPSGMTEADLLASLGDAIIIPWDEPITESICERINHGSSVGSETAEKPSNLLDINSMSFIMPELTEDNSSLTSPSSFISAPVSNDATNSIPSVSKSVGPEASEKIIKSITTSRQVQTAIKSSPVLPNNDRAKLEREEEIETEIVVDHLETEQDNCQPPPGVSEELFSEFQESLVKKPWMRPDMLDLWTKDRAPKKVYDARKVTQLVISLYDEDHPDYKYYMSLPPCQVGTTNYTPSWATAPGVKLAGQQQISVDSTKSPSEPKPTLITPSSVKLLSPSKPVSQPDQSKEFKTDSPRQIRISTVSQQPSTSPTKNVEVTRQNISKLLQKYKAGELDAESVRKLVEATQSLRESKGGKQVVLNSPIQPRSAVTTVRTPVVKAAVVSKPLLVAASSTPSQTKSNLVYTGTGVTEPLKFTMESKFKNINLPNSSLKYVVACDPVTGMTAVKQHVVIGKTVNAAATNVRTTTTTTGVVSAVVGHVPTAQGSNVTNPVRVTLPSQQTFTLVKGTVPSTTQTFTVLSTGRPGTPKVPTLSSGSGSVRLATIQQRPRIVQRAKTVTQPLANVPKSTQQPIRARKQLLSQSRVVQGTKPETFAVVTIPTKGIPSSETPPVVSSGSDILAKALADTDILPSDSEPFAEEPSANLFSPQSVVISGTLGPDQLPTLSFDPAETNTVVNR